MRYTGTPPQASDAANSAASPLRHQLIINAAKLRPAAGLLALQRHYAGLAGLKLLDKNLEQLEQRLAQAKEKGACLLALGWGGGLLAKSSWLDTTNAEYRQILQQFALYNRALSTNLPFPKTRRIVFLDNQPATLPGWVELTVN